MLRRLYLDLIPSRRRLVGTIDALFQERPKGAAPRPRRGRAQVARRNSEVEAPQRP